MPLPWATTSFLGSGIWLWICVLPGAQAQPCLQPFQQPGQAELLCFQERPRGNLQEGDGRPRSGESPSGAPLPDQASSLLGKSPLLDHQPEVSSLPLLPPPRYGPNLLQCHLIQEVSWFPGCF